MKKIRTITLMVLYFITNFTFFTQSQAENQIQTEVKKHRSWQKMKIDNTKVTIPIYCQDSSLAAISTLIRGYYGIDIREEYLLALLLQQNPGDNRICQDALVPVIQIQNALLVLGFKLVIKPPESIISKILTGNTKKNSLKSKAVNTDNQLNAPYITLLLRGLELDYVVVKGLYPQSQEILFSDPKNNLENTILDMKTFKEYQNVVNKEFELHWEILPLDYSYALLANNWEEKSKEFMSQNITQKAHPTRWVHLTSPILPLAQ